jgi:biopolymer transport protein TolQ
MSNDLSFLHLVLNASPVVQLVMSLLVGASVLSWTMIFDRSKVLKRAKREADSFEKRFWSGGDLGELYGQVERDAAAGMAAIFRAGFKEFARLRKSSAIEPRDMLGGVQRSMRVALSREMDHLETHLPFLATVGSTSPYVGLFGTVWGIMNAFTALGNVKQATLALVAPGIAEALVATAIGLFAAIPAVIAYNRYVSDVERLNNRYDDFVEEFSSILQRQAHG